MGEEEQYYIKEHHEPIVSPEIWDAVQEIKKSRYRKSPMSIEGTRKKYSRKFAFMEMFHLLADNFDDVLDSVIHSVEETVSNDESAVKLQRVEKALSLMESKRKKLTDMLLDDKITKEAYDAKYNELTRKINQTKGERSLYSSNVEAQKHITYIR